MNDNKRNYGKKNLKVNYCIIILLIFYGISLENKRRMICPFSSNITLKIKGPGDSNIFYGGTSCNQDIIFKSPDEVYIEDDKQTYVKNIYHFEGTINTVKLVWHTTISTCNCLFKDCILLRLISKILIFLRDYLQMKCFIIVNH